METTISVTRWTGREPSHPTIIQVPSRHHDSLLAPNSLSARAIELWRAQSGEDTAVSRLNSIQQEVLFLELLLQGIVTCTSTLTKWTTGASSALAEFLAAPDKN